VSDTVTIDTRMITLDDQHRYWHGDRQLVGTTFALAQGGFIDENTLRYANVARGHAVHAIAALEMIEQLDHATVDPLLVGYHEAVMRVRDDLRLETSRVEQVGGIPELGYGSTLDWLGTIQPRGRSRRRTLIDWKTYAYTHWHRLQVGGAYLPVAHKCYDDSEPIDTLVVQLEATGEYKLFPFVPDPSERMVFLGAVSGTRWRMKYGRGGQLYGRSSSN
jgi:hypothetical protein